jgi:DNA-directed RNA polymerase sigma subunit (sigma70/sigma32)
MTAETLSEVRAAHERLELIRAEELAARQELRAAIVDARAAGHTLVAIGEVLGLSKQRVDQLSR